MPAVDSRRAIADVLAPTGISPNCTGLQDPFGSRSPGRPVVPLER
jgi:hypothetical protein